MASRSGNTVGVVATGLQSPPVGEGSAFFDDGLVTAAREGDRAAFGHLYERYARMVHGILLARVPNGDVDDFVQDVFVLALRRLSTLRETRSFGSWLAAIARNLANDHYRHSPPEDQLTEEALDSEIKCGAASAGAEDATAALEAVRGLPDAYKEPLILRLVEGMTGPEIAARTGLTHGSVRVNLHRGMQLLRAKLNPNPSGSGPEQEVP